MRPPNKGKAAPAPRGGFRRNFLAWVQHEGVDGAANVLQRQRAEFLEREAEPIGDLLAHHPRHADRPRRTDALQSGGHVYAIPVQVRAIGDHVADIHPHPEADALVGGVIAIERRASRAEPR